MNPMGNALLALHTLDADPSRSSMLAQFDPRALLLATLGFIVVVVSFDRYALLAMLPLTLFPTALCAAGHVPMRWILKKVLVASPFAIMVGIFNPFLDAATLVSVWGIPVSGGWLSFLSILLRFALTVSAALALIAITGLPAICSGLENLGIPRPLTMQLLLLQRYAEVLAGEASRMRMAHELRAGTSKLGLTTYASLIGQLLLRSLDRAQRVHVAMVSRGFDGQWNNHRRATWRTKDSVFLTACMGGCGLARFINLPQEMGALLLRSLA